MADWFQTSDQNQSQLASLAKLLSQIAANSPSASNSLIRVFQVETTYSTMSCMLSELRSGSWSYPSWVVLDFRSCIIL